jgi:hypothetical protein
MMLFLAAHIFGMSWIDIAVDTTPQIARVAQSKYRLFYNSHVHEHSYLVNNHLNLQIPLGSPGNIQQHMHCNRTPRSMK